MDVGWTVKWDLLLIYLGHFRFNLLHLNYVHEFHCVSQAIIIHLTLTALIGLFVHRNLFAFALFCIIHKHDMPFGVL